MQLLAACIVNDGQFNRVNVELNLFELGEVTPVMPCGDVSADPEAMLASTFIVDLNGNLAWALNLTMCEEGPF
jgi:hypothetical protein